MDKIHRAVGIDRDVEKIEEGNIILVVFLGANLEGEDVVVLGVFVSKTGAGATLKR